MTSPIRIRSVYPFSAADRAWLGSIDSRIELIHDGEDTAEWVAALDDDQVQILWANYPPPTLEQTPRLLWLAMSSAGVDTVTSLDPWSLGLMVTNGSGLHAVGMGEFVLAAALFATQRFEARMAGHVAHAWPPEAVAMLLAGRRLRGLTAAIIGYGSVGREAARLLAGCGVRILALKSDPSKTVDTGWRELGTGDPDGSIPERIAGPESLREMAKEADFVVLALPSTPRTQGIVDAAVFSAMRPDSWLINVGRGALVDEEALIGALRTGRIGGAVLDVVAQEPLPPDHPLWELPNCLVVPHVSGSVGADALWHITAGFMAENLQRHLRGETLINRTSGSAGY